MFSQANNRPDACLKFRLKREACIGRVEGALTLFWLNAKSILICYVCETSSW